MKQCRNDDGDNDHSITVCWVNVDDILALFKSLLSFQRNSWHDNITTQWWIDHTAICVFVFLFVFVLVMLFFRGFFSLFLSFPFLFYWIVWWIINNYLLWFVVSNEMANFYVFMENWTNDFDWWKLVWCHAKKITKTKTTTTKRTLSAQKDTVTWYWNLYLSITFG